MKLWKEMSGAIVSNYGPNKNVLGWRYTGFSNKCPAMEMAHIRLKEDSDAGDMGRGPPYGVVPPSGVMCNSTARYIHLNIFPLPCRRVLSCVQHPF